MNTESTAKYLVLLAPAPDARVVLSNLQAGTPRVDIDLGPCQSAEGAQ